MEDVHAGAHQPLKPDKPITNGLNNSHLGNFTWEETWGAPGAETTHETFQGQPSAASLVHLTPLIDT
jgi:hypothetical protein